MTYLINALDPSPTRWRDMHGPIRVLAGPAKGWLMCKRPNERPFVLRVSELLGAVDPPFGIGPFEIVGVKLTRIPSDNG